MRHETQHRNRKPCTPHAELARVREIGTTRLSKEVGVSQVHVWYILNGHRMPSLDVAARLAKALGMSLDALHKMIEAAKTRREVAA